MKYIKDNLLSFFALIISISALFICLFRCEPISADWMAILVAILALLVTFLVGWQIYKTIEINQTMKGYDNIVNNKIKGVSEDIDHIMNSYDFILSSHRLIGTRCPFDESLKSLMNALEENLKIKSLSSQGINIEKTLDEMLNLIKRNEEETDIKIPKDDLKHYKHLLRRSNNEKAEIIEDFLLKFYNA